MLGDFAIRDERDDREQRRLAIGRMRHARGFDPNGRSLSGAHEFVVHPQ
jgi:hypothetical protein